MAIDYYQILQIGPAADQAEIKAAYRRLAHRYHPDKNPDNKSTDAYFELVKEAYETLTNPVKKENYLQTRWLIRANGLDYEQPILRPEHLLLQVLSASDKIRQVDIYRMDKHGIKDQLQLLLADERISLLNDFNEISINDAIVQEFMQMITVLPATQQLQVLRPLRKINSNYIASIREREDELTNNAFWETWKPAFLILLVILLCILIWGSSLKY